MSQQPLHEVTCPACSATIRARMSDARPDALDRMLDAWLDMRQMPQFARGLRCAPVLSQLIDDLVEDRDRTRNVDLTHLPPDQGK